jgi:Dolichyl-phosphate-mannose-protein mannosyltransferase
MTMSRRSGSAGLVAIGLSVVATFLVAVAGPSVMEPALPGRPGQPPWAFDLHRYLPDHLTDYLAVGLTALGLAAGTLGLVLVLRAMRAGWTISARAVLLAGILAATVLTLVPPFGSSDHLSYAAYGRMLVTGHNPYLTTPQQLINLGDPVAKAVQDWRGQRSVYGPLATGIQGLASLIAGTSARLTVFLLGLANLVAFVVTALLLYRMTRGRPDRQLRSVLLWAANPLLLQVLVAGAHVDVQLIVFCVAAVAVMYGAGEPTIPRALLAGLLVGLGFSVKVTAALVGLGIAVAVTIALWRQRRRLLRLLTALAVGFAVPAGVSLALGGSAMLKDTSQASDMVSIGSPWRLIRSGLEHLTGYHAATDIVKIGAIALAVILVIITAVVLAHGLPTSTTPAWLPLALVLGWLFAWPYVLPWYDALGWAFLALVPATQVDWLLLIRTSVLGFAYLPARTYGVHMPAGLNWLQPVIRNGIAPVVLAGTVVWLILMMPWRSP